MDQLEESREVDALVLTLKSGVKVRVEVEGGGCDISADKTGANEALLDKIYEEWETGKLTKVRLWQLSKEYDRPEPVLGAPFDLKNHHVIGLNIKLFVDGDKWCALIGENLQEGESGFGNTRLEALIECVSNLDLLKQWICMDCGKKTNVLAPIHHRGDLGRCPACNTKNWLKTMPPPIIDDMEVAEGSFANYLNWPHHYIPPQCPYCNGNINRIFVGSYHDHVCHENTCEKCRVYFGFTD